MHSIKKPFQLVTSNFTHFIMNCCICMDALGEHDTQVNILPCKHGDLFHTTCLERWTMANPTCPVCRGNVETFPLVPHLTNAGTEDWEEHHATAMLQVMLPVLTAHDMTELLEHTTTSLCVPLLWESLRQQREDLIPSLLHRAWIHGQPMPLVTMLLEASVTCTPDTLMMLADSVDRNSGWVMSLRDRALLGSRLLRRLEAAQVQHDAISAARIIRVMAVTGVDDVLLPLEHTRHTTAPRLMRSSHRYMSIKNLTAATALCLCGSLLLFSWFRS